MKKAESISIAGMVNKSLDNNVFQEIAAELETGVADTDDKLTEFKVEQKIASIDASSEFSFGGFVNSNSKIKSLKTYYMAALMSNRYKPLMGNNGEVLALRRYGIGFALTLEVKDVETKINANYGVVAAAGALDLSKVAYKISVYGVLTPELTQYLPKQEGDFTNDIFIKIQDFFAKAKEHIGDMTQAALYPIEIIKNTQIVPDKSHTVSIYFASHCIASNKSLSDCIKLYQQKNLNINDNVIQFMYSYFGIKDAYVTPSITQRQDAAKWISGQYNKVENTIDSTWVEIDSAYTYTLSEDSVYKPHPVPADWAQSSKVLEDENFEISANYSSEIKIGAMLNASSAFNTYTLGRRIVHYMDTNDNPEPGSKVIETRYGVGIRIIMKISNTEFGTDISFANIGAIAELNLGNVEYEISGIGINDSDLIKLLPVPQNINQNTFSEINKTIETLKTKISNLDPTDFEPQALRIRVEEPENVDPTLQAQSTVFAYRNIKEKERLNDTLNRAKSLGLLEEPIKEVYKELGIEGNDRPVRSDKLEAIEWLEFE
ncbi:hypothetical protein GWA97_11315 [Flavobacterium sp. LaA7.5]|nr:hypothetical protein [Flavobacterium salilacus subsp. altitudinum]